MWEEIALPYVFERMTAFSIPTEDRVLISSYDGLHLVRLAPEIEVRHWPDQPEKYHGGDDDVELCGVRYETLGLNGGSPLMATGRGEWVELDLPRERAQILDRAGHFVQEVEFHNLSGDWGYATFS